MTTPDGGDDRTRIDPGRSYRDDEPPTVLDPGRTRPRSADGEAWSVLLAPELADRFKVVRELTANAAQAQAMVVRDRSTGAERVLKVYRPDQRPDRRIWQFLRGRPSRHVVDLLEAGEAGGRDYELMEYLAGGDLAALRRRTTGGLAEDLLKTVVRQVTDGLCALHDNDVVHRDLKPSNLVLRTLNPFEVVLVDLGISRYVDPDDPFTRTSSGTVRYMPPEFRGGGGMVLPAYDWWSLGVTLLELATGRPILEGLDDDQLLLVRLNVKPPSVAGVSDPRIRLLCQGLLTSDPDDRWGATQIRDWLAGGSPPVAAEPVRAADRPGAGEKPFEYLGTEYYYRDELATAIATSWATAVDWFWRGGKSPREDRLMAWLRQFPGESKPATGNRREPLDVRLLRLLRVIDPKAPPVYRNENITPDRLPELATRAIQGQGSSADVVNELWEFDLLPILATGSPAPGLGGGTGLNEVRNRWTKERQRLLSASTAINDDEAGAELARLIKEEQGRIKAISLYAATAPARDTILQGLESTAREIDVPWFSDLVARRGLMWVAFALQVFAKGAAQRKADQEAQERAQREWLRRNEAVREWSRRQNRPQALAWGVCGVFALGVVLVMLVAVGDMADVASDAAVVDAWFAVVVAAAVALSVESLLAWEIGGRFHPGYSLIGAGLIRLGRFARSLVGRRSALAVVVGVLLGAAVITVLAPFCMPISVAVLMVIWSVSRYLRWNADLAQEQADIARTEP